MSGATPRETGQNDLDRSRVAKVFVMVFLDMLVYAMLIPVFPYQAQEFGASGFQVTLLMSGYAGMQLVFNPFWGALSDKFGRRPLMLVSLSGSLLSAAVFALSSHYTWVLVSRLIGGLLIANLPLAQSLFADLSPPHKRSAGMAYFGIAFGLAFILGPALGGWVSGWGYAWAGWVAAALTLVNMGLVWRMLPETRFLQTSQRSPSQLWRVVSPVHNLSTSRQLGVLGLVGMYLVFVVSASFVESTFSLFMKNHHQLPSTMVGLLLAYFGLILVGIQGWLVPKLTARYGDKRMIELGSLLMIMGLWLFVNTDWGPAMIVTLAVLSAGMGVMYIAILSAVSRRVPASLQGRVLGITASVASFSRALGPLWAGYAYDTLGVHAPYVSAMILMGLLLFLVLLGWLNVPAIPTLRTEEG
jgi:multidrug resistance protein